MKHERPGDERSADERLDELLARAGQVDVPETLAASTKRALREARADARLDRLLGEVPPPRVPPGLPARVLAGLAGERRPRGPRRLAPLLAAAALVLTLGVAFAALRFRDAREAHEGTTELVRGAPERELLVALEALENWELLTDEDVDLLLAGLDVADVTLLELVAEEAEPNGGAADPESRDTKKG